MAGKKNENSCDASLSAALFWIVIAFLGAVLSRVEGALFYLVLGALLFLVYFPISTIFKTVLALSDPSTAARPVDDTGRVFGRTLRLLFCWATPVIKAFFDVFFKSSQHRAKTKNATFSNPPTSGPSASGRADIFLDPENVGVKEPFLMREESSQVNAENWLISLFVSLPIDLAAIVAICRWGGELTEGYGVLAKLSFFFFSVVFVAILAMTLVRVIIKWGRLLRDARTFFPDPILYWRFWGEEEGEEDGPANGEKSGEGEEAEEESNFHEIVVTRYVQKKDDSPIIDSTARVVVPETINGFPVTRIADAAFEDSEFLGEVVLSDAVTTVGARAFANCPRLYTLTLTDAVTSIGADAFSQNTCLVVPTGSYAEEWARMNGARTRVVPSSNKPRSTPSASGSSNASQTPTPTPAGNSWGSFYWIERGEDATITGIASTQIEKLKIPSKVAGRLVVEIGARAFQGGSFQTATFPRELQTIGFCAFEGCANLARVELPRRLLTIGSLAFQACRKLSNVSLPNGIERIEDSAFVDCDALATLFLPSSLKHIGASPFSAQTTLTVIAGSYAEKWAAGQSDCRYRVLGSPGRATGATSGASSRSPAPVARNADPAANANVFYVPKGYKNSRCDEVGEAVFKGDPSITEAAIPEGIERVENMAFYECFNLCRAILPDSLRAIGAGAFAECPRLKEIVIPNGVTRIGRKAFGKETTLVVAPYSYAQRWANENGMKTRVFDWQERLQEVQILRGARRS